MGRKALYQNLVILYPTTSTITLHFWKCRNSGRFRLVMSLLPLNNNAINDTDGYKITRKVDSAGQKAALFTFSVILIKYSVLNKQI